MAAAELGADNRALHPDPRLLHLRAILQHVPTHHRVRHLLQEAETATLAWDDPIKTKVLDAVAPAEEVRNRADLPEIEAVLRVAVVLRVGVLPEIVVDPLAAEHNQVDHQEIEVDQLQAVQPEAVATTDLDVQIKTAV